MSVSISSPSVNHVTAGRAISAPVALAAVLSVAIAVRVAAMLSNTYVVFADETFQYLEQGHRVAFGQGILPWEYLDGIRSWLLPWTVAAVMSLAALFSDSATVIVFAVRLLFAALSLIVVWVGFETGRRRGGLGAALLTGGFCAIWFDLVYFAPTVLADTAAAHLGLLGIALGEVADARDRSRRLAFAALCLGLAVSVRYQCAPALAAAVLWQHRLAWDRWRVLLPVGIATVVLCVGLLDWVTWGTPFQSVWLNFLRNQTDGVSAAISIEPGSYYTKRPND